MAKPTESKTNSLKTVAIVFDYDAARTIFEAEEVCFSEGMGPDLGPLLVRLGEVFPELLAEFSWLKFSSSRDRS